MRIVITGGAGFIGSFLAERLLARGAAVALYDSLDPQVHPHGPPEYLPAGARLVVADVRDRARLGQEIAGADAVLHLAAAVGVSQSLYRVHDFVETNVAGTGLLLELLSERRPRPAKLIVLTSNTQ